MLSAHACCFLIRIRMQGIRHADTQRLTDDEVVGYAVFSMLALGLPALHEVRNIKLDWEQYASVRRDVTVFLAKLVSWSLQAVHKYSLMNGVVADAVHHGASFFKWPALRAGCGC
jgi:hypothetical protein